MTLAITSGDAQAATATAEHSAYRPDIDGLRAWAVGLVVAYHFFPNHLRAGFIGVDIFFVISGYLITSIIVGQMESGRWSYRSFYTRRINRIFPALALVLVANLSLGWYALVSDEFQALGKHVAASSVFASNFALWNEAGYFDNAADTKPLLHLWSLAIEEQFYIAWPLLLAVGINGRRRVLALAALACVISFALSVHAAHYDPTAAYYSPLTRCWQLAVGGLLACLRRHGPVRLPFTPDARATAGAVLLAAAIALIDRQRAYPGWWALLPTLGAALLISAGTSAWVNRALLAPRPLVWIGLISYPLYLWHWPVLVWTKLIFMTGNLPASWRMGLIAVSVMLAWLTYVLLEKPVRQRNRGRTACQLLAVVALAGGVGLCCWIGALSNRMTGSDLAKVVNAPKDWDYPPSSFRTFVRFSDYSFYVKDGSGPGATLFVGDSNIEQYAPRVEAVVDGTPNSPAAIFATKGACPFSAPLLAERRRDCSGKLAQINEIIESDDVTTVVFGQAWANLAAIVDDPAVAASFEARLSSIPEGKRVFVILNMPSGLEFSPASLLRGSRLDRLEYRPEASQAVDPAVARRPFVQVNAIIREIAARHGVTVLDPFDSFCSPTGCPVVDGTGSPLYKDTAHLTASNARQSASFIDVTLRPAGR